MRRFAIQIQTKMNIFYEPQIKQNLCLNEEESRHAVKVLRLSAGDLLHVVDGMGGFMSAKSKIRNAKNAN